MAVKSEMYSLEYASDDLKNDREFMLQVVKLNKNSLEYGSDRLRNDK